HQRTRAALYDANSYLVLPLVSGIDGEEVSAVSQVRDTVIGDQSTQRIERSGEGSTAGDALAPAGPEEPRVRDPLSRINSLRCIMREISTIVHVLRMESRFSDKAGIEGQRRRRSHGGKIYTDGSAVLSRVGSRIVELFEKKLFCRRRRDSSKE